MHEEKGEERRLRISEDLRAKSKSKWDCETFAMNRTICNTDQEGRKGRWAEHVHCEVGGTV